MMIRKAMIILVAFLAIGMATAVLATLAAQLVFLGGITL